MANMKRGTAFFPMLLVLFSFSYFKEPKDEVSILNILSSFGCSAQATDKTNVPVVSQGERGY
jgi:hypothetical protein